MSDFNLSNLISKYVNYQAITANRANVNVHNRAAQAQNAMPTPEEIQTTTSQASQTVSNTSGTLQMATLTGGDNSLYIKDVMNLPKNLNELFYMIQRNLTLAQFNQQFANAINKNPLSSTQAQILAQLESLESSELQEAFGNLNRNSLSQLQSSLKSLSINGDSLINLSEIAQLIQANGKDAIAKLITTMANSAKMGITDLSQLKDAAKLINASVAAASQNDNAKTMKLLMLLYLPWLPLQEGVGFDIEIETNNGNEDEASILTITITTINYGVVIATLILESPSSVSIYVECSKDFPKDELMLRIENEEKHYSVQSQVSFETNEKDKNIMPPEKQNAKINMADTNKINPYLLLMAHTVIRHTLEIDKNKSDGIVSHID